MSQRNPVLLAEAVGTAILIIGGPGPAILGGGIGTLGVALAFGLSLLIAVYLVGHVSGCHINPAVTFAMWVTKRMKGVDALWYAGAQVVGAAVGGGVIWAVLRFGETGNRAELFTAASNQYDAPFYRLAGVIVAEVALTALLVLVVLGVTKSAAVPAGFAAIPIGFTLALVHMISIPVDNTSVNPARSIATAIFAKSGASDDLWVFLVFPMVGALIGALAHQVMHGEKATLPLPSGGAAFLSGFGKALGSRPSTAKRPAARKGPSPMASFRSGFGKSSTPSAPAKKAPAKKARKR